MHAKLWPLAKGFLTINTSRVKAQATAPTEDHGKACGWLGTQSPSIIVRLNCPDELSMWLYQPHSQASTHLRSEPILMWWRIQLCAEVRVSHDLLYNKISSMTGNKYKVAYVLPNMRYFPHIYYFMWWQLDATFQKISVTNQGELNR